MKTKTFVMSFAFMFILALASSLTLALNAYDSSAYEKDYSIKNIPLGEDPSLMVSVLKYEPYPVIAGEWFDLWVKVQNVGEKSASNLTITLSPEYPFYATDNLTRNFGILFGTKEAFQVDQTYDSTQVVLKFRVKALENAPSGSSNIQIIMSHDSSDPASASFKKDLPIEIFSSKNLPANNESTPVNTSQNIFYGVIGLITGIFIVLFIGVLKSKHKSKAN